MSQQSQHKFYLHQPFAFSCALESIDRKHIEVLKRYGSWLSALADGRLTALTPAQEHFIRVHLGEVAPMTDIEHAWFSYRVQCLYEDARKLEADLQGSTKYSYDAVCEAYYKVACLGHREAAEWCHREAAEWFRQSGSLNRRVYPRFSHLGSLEIKPNLASNEGRAGLRTRVPRPDYDSSPDDWDSQDWEALLGGPDVD